MSANLNPVIIKKTKKHDVVMDAQFIFLQDLSQKFNLNDLLPANTKKQDYKKLLLVKGGGALNQQLTEMLSKDSRYSERFQQVSSLAEKLEWTLKAQVDIALENWWNRQGEHCGFGLVVDSSGLSKLQNSAYQWHALPEKGKQAGFSSVDFTGELQVTDVRKFEQALFSGIGRSMAVDFGLLMIRKKIML